MTERPANEPGFTVDGLLTAQFRLSTAAVLVSSQPLYTISARVAA